MNIGIKLLFVILVTGIVIAGEFRATSEEYLGKRVGTVYYDEEAIIRFASKGAYTSSFARAQQAAINISTYLRTEADISNVHWTYINDIYTAMYKTIPIFSIRADEVEFNHATPESLGQDWLMNLQTSLRLKNHGKPITPVMVTSIKPITPIQKKELIKPTPVEEIKVIAQSPSLADLEEINKTRKATPITNIAIQKNPTTDILDQQALVQNELLAYKASALHSKKYALLFAFIIITLVINTLIILILLIKIKRINQQQRGITLLTKTDKLEELENTVSGLIKELELASTRVSTEAKTLLLSLEEKTHVLAELASTPKQAILVPASTQPLVPPPIIPTVENKDPSLFENKTELPAPPQPAETISPPQLATEPAETNFPITETPQITDVEPKASEEKKDWTTEIDSIGNDVSLNKQQKILKLVEMTVPKEIIAKTYNMGVGEIELIIQLNL